MSIHNQSKSCTESTDSRTSSYRAASINQLAELEARLANLPIEHQQSLALLHSEKLRLSQQLLSHQASGEWLTAPLQ